jgi:hypothetical protein
LSAACSRNIVCGVERTLPAVEIRNIVCGEQERLRDVMQHTVVNVTLSR